MTPVLSKKGKVEEDCAAFFLKQAKRYPPAPNTCSEALLLLIPYEPFLLRGPTAETKLICFSTLRARRALKRKEIYVDWKGLLSDFIMCSIFLFMWFHSYIHAASFHSCYSASVSHVQQASSSFTMCFLQYTFAREGNHDGWRDKRIMKGIWGQAR